VTPRRAWLTASIAAGFVSILIAVSGGVVTSVGGVRVSARSWQVPAVIGLVTSLVWGWRASRSSSVADDLASLSRSLDSRGRGVVPGLACVVSLSVLVFGTYSASGSDASGYVSQAAMWSDGHLALLDPLVQLPGWPLSAGDTAPLGWKPGLAPGSQVPTYAPGLPWLMALPHRVAGIEGAMAVVAVAAGLAIWAAGAVSWQLGGGAAAVLGSVLLATSPTLLVHAFQPMSDVPVTAAWMLCWWFVTRARPVAAGVAAAVAIVVRPNLAPLALVPVVVLWRRGDRGRDYRAALTASVPIAVAGLVIAVLQWHWYGSPLRSGYGSADELFALTNIAPNLRLYAAWALDAEPSMVVAALVASAALYRCHADCPLVRGMAVFAAGVILAYLVYAVFEVWSYLRFLLPAMSVLAVLAGVATARAVAVVPVAGRGVVLLVLVAGIAASGLFHARTRGVFTIAQVHARTPEVGRVLATALPPHAVLLTGEQSGSMRYYTGRPIVRWEPLTPTTLATALAVLEANGFEVWWVLDQFEEAGVRSRFPDVPAAALDWPPAIEGGPLMRTRAWRLRDRR
jgi:hypothetical protein